MVSCSILFLKKKVENTCKKKRELISGKKINGESGKSRQEGQTEPSITNNSLLIKACSSSSSCLFFFFLFLSLVSPAITILMSSVLILFFFVTLKNKIVDLAHVIYYTQIITPTYYNE